MLNHKKVSERPEPLLRVILVISIAQQILLYGSCIAEGFNWAEGLPLHISRISSLLGIAWLICRNNKIIDVLFFFGLFAYASLFYPSRVHPITHPIGWIFLINHIITILLPILAVYATNWRPTKEALFQAMKSFLVYLAAAMFTNKLTNGNYFYMTQRIAFDDIPLWQYTILSILMTYVIFTFGYLLGSLLIRAYRRKNPATMQAYRQI